MTPTIGFVILLCAFATLIGARLAQIMDSRKRRYAKHADLFYAKSKPLLADHDTPIEILELISFLNERLSDRSSARYAFLAMAEISKRIEKSEDVSGAAPEAVTIFLEKRPELDRVFGELCAAALFAVSFNSLVFGWLLRRFFLFGVMRDKTKAEEISFDIKEKEFSGLRYLRA